MIFSFYFSFLLYLVSPMHSMKLLPLLGTALALISVSWAALIGVHGILHGTANVQPPDLYPAKNNELHVNEPGNGTVTIAANMSETFTHQLSPAKTFYPMQADVLLNTSATPDTVQFDYGNGTFVTCQPENDYYHCPPTNSSIQVDAFRLKLTAGDTDIDLSFGTATVVEVNTA